MADSSSMVSGTPWRQIVFCSAFVVLGAILVLSFQHIDASTSVYSATGGELDLAIVDGITKAEKNTVEVVGNARAVVVPHHLVAPEAIALGIRALVPSHPRIVVVVSPDHFGRCPTRLCTTSGRFETFFGDVAISVTGVKRLLSHTDLVETADLFTDEHGVYSIVPFIKHYLPQAAVVPIVVSQRGVGDEQSRAEIIAVLDQLMKRSDTALVVSTDFSHYLPLTEAHEHDVHTQRVFCEGDVQALLDLQNPSQSDCPLCLWIAHEVAKKYGFWNPVALWHSNSAELLHDISVQETTSHFTFVLSAEPQQRQCAYTRPAPRSASRQ